MNSKSMYKNKFVNIGVILFFIGTFLCALKLGSAKIEYKDVIDVIRWKLFHHISVEDASMYIVWDLRVPRTLLALVVGGGLAVAGASMQAVTQNVLAEPYILGGSSGALAATALAILIGNQFKGSVIGIPFFAFGGSLIALILVYVISSIGMQNIRNKLILTGMAVSLLLNALSQFFIILIPDTQLRGLLAWSMGSFAGARLSNILVPIVFILIGVIYIFSLSSDLDLMSLGQETALSLGTNVKALTRKIIIVVSLITGATVSSSGIIALVGFIIPHIVRTYVGARHRRLFPIAFLLGSIFMMWMDILGRTILAPKEIPVGIFSAFIGVPFFIWIIIQERSHLRKAK